MALAGEGLKIMDEFETLGADIKLVSPFFDVGAPIVQPGVREIEERVDANTRDALSMSWSPNPQFMPRLWI